MRKSVLLAVLTAWSCLVASANAGTIVGGVAASGNDPWTIEEVWTDGTTTLDLKISGEASVGFDVLTLLENFIKADFAGTNFHQVSGVPTATVPPAGGLNLDPPPIAPVPEPSGVVLAVSGLGVLAFAVRRRTRRV